jgi:5-formyltetrahydrofolate cyclo-ligase
MKRRRAELGAARISEISAQIGRRVLALNEYKEARRVMCYCALPAEVQTADLIGQMLRDGKEVYLPVMGKGRSLTAVRLRAADALHQSRFGVLEPDGNEAVEPEMLDLILVPGLAFDRMGGRLGYGAGYYDRFLPRCTGLIAALAAECQMAEHVPVQAHDVPMQRIITERAVYDCVNGGSLGEGGSGR